MVAAALVGCETNRETPPASDVSAAAIRTPVRAGDNSRPNVVMIVIDTLRSDHLGAYGYARDTSPAIDALARVGVRFDRAYATSSWTKPSVASMFTGRVPSSHGVTDMYRGIPDQIETLAERLEAERYATAGVVSHLLIGSRWGFERGFAQFDDTEGKGPQHVSTAGVVERAGRYLEQLAKQELPFFLFVHFFDPHDSFMDHDEVTFAGAPEGRVGPGHLALLLRVLDPPLNPAEIGYLRDLYDEEIRVTDAGIGSLIGTMRRAGVFDDSIIVVTADHGEEFLEGGWLGHGNSLSEILLRVPLIVKVPGQSAPRVVSSPVSLAALVPTILDLVGVPYDPTRYDSPSLSALLTDGGLPPEAPVVAELAYAPPESGLKTLSPDRPWLEAVIAGEHKLVRDNIAERDLLYEVGVDLSEVLIEPGERAEIRADMQAKLETARSARVDPGITDETEAQRRPDEAVMEILRRLGYAERGAD